MKKKLLLNILFGVLYIYLFDFWFLLLRREDFTMCLGAVSAVGLFVALLRNNKQILQASLWNFAAIALQIIMIFAFDSFLLPGLSRISEHSFGGLGYAAVVFLIGGFSLLLVIASFLAMIGERRGKNEEE